MSLVFKATFVLAVLTAGHAAAMQLADDHVTYVPPPPPPPLAETQAKAAQGDAGAEYLLGLAYQYSGGELPCDRLTALDWFRKSAAQGNADAKTAADQTEADYARYNDLKARAEAGDTQAEYDFSVDILNSGHCFGETDYLKWQRLAAEGGNVQGENAIGNYYLDGYKYDLHPRDGARPAWAANDGDQNLLEAIMWYAKSAEQDNLSAEYVLSGIYALDTPARDLERMEYWMQKVAYRDGGAYFQPGGDAYNEGKTFLDAQQELCRYYNGQGMFRPVQDDDYSLMVKLDSQPDYVKLRVCYTYVSQGIDEPSAFVGLGDLYAEGKGGPVDTDKAREAYESAVNGRWVGFDYSKPLVMAKLGLLYAGQGDDVHAYFWLKLMGEYRPYGKTEWTTDTYEGTIYKTIDAAKAALTTVKGRLPSAVRRLQDKAATEWLATHPPEIPLPPLP